MKKTKYLMLSVLLTVTGAISQTTGQSQCVLQSAENGNLISVRGQVSTGGHDLLLHVPNCPRAIVLIFAGSNDLSVAKDSSKGKVQGPEEPEGVERLKLRHDRDFKLFEKRITAAYESTPTHICMGCAKYNVEATFSGMLEVAPLPEDFSGPAFITDSAGNIVGQAGFGHPPSRKYRLVVASVSKVAATKVPPSVYGLWRTR